MLYTVDVMIINLDVMQVQYPSSSDLNHADDLRLGLSILFGAEIRIIFFIGCIHSYLLYCELYIFSSLH